MMNDLEQRIRERAYQIWEQEGRVHGRAEQHWQMAMRELTASSSEVALDAIVLAVKTEKKTRRTARAKMEAAAAPAPRRRRAPTTLQ